VIRHLVVAVTCAGCTATQSARTVAPGNAELSVGVGRVSMFQKDIEEGDWTGHLMVRLGIVDGFDVGIHAEHTPGSGGAGAFAIDPKVRVSRSGRATLAFGVPGGILYSEGDEVEFDGGFMVPTLYLSTELSPSVDLVTNVRFAVTSTRTTFDNFQSHTWIGASVGPRFTDETRTWAAQPEIGVVRVEQLTYLTFGLTVAVGN
jgi:hypothetical protein